MTSLNSLMPWYDRSYRTKHIQISKFYNLFPTHFLYKINMNKESVEQVVCFAPSTLAHGRAMSILGVKLLKYMIESEIFLFFRWYSVYVQSTRSGGHPHI